MKTNELAGTALDWAVAKCEGKEMRAWRTYKRLNQVDYSTNWAQGGEIIEREEISIAKVGRSLGDAIAPHPEGWAAHIDGVYTNYGTTPLIAAMRCYVASKLGDEVEVPVELI